MVLVSYDVRTVDREGERRLRRISKACRNFGQRVQFSVFEIEVDPALWVALRATLLEIIEPFDRQPPLLLPGQGMEEQGRARGRQGRS